MRKSITRKSLTLAGLLGALLALVFSVSLGHAANAPMTSDPMLEGARHFQHAPQLNPESARSDCVQELKQLRFF